VLDLRYNIKAKVLVAAILRRGAWTLTGYFTGGSATWQSASASAAEPAPPMALPVIARKSAPRSRIGAGQAAAPRK
jgi:hypothetical protein